MSKEEKVSEVEDKKLTDDELENVSGGAALIGKKQVGIDSVTIKPVTGTTPLKK